MDQRYYDASTGQESKPAGKTADHQGMLEQLAQKLRELVQPINPTKRRDQIEEQERQAESPEARPSPTPAPSPTPKPKHDGAHPGFKAVQSQIASREGISQDRAGAILAASSRRASPAAKKANPKLNKVRG